MSWIVPFKLDQAITFYRIQPNGFYKTLYRQLWYNTDIYSTEEPFMSDTPDIPALLTTKEVATWLKVDVRTVRMMVRRGELSAAKVGRAWRFQRADLQRLLAPTNPRKPEGAQEC